MKDLYFVPECYVDTNLVESLLDSDGVNHQKGCNTVVNTMKGKLLNDSFAVGVIDSDKRKPSYVNEFTEIAHTEHLSLLKHATKAHYLVIVSPAMDKFILDCAEEEDVDLSEYDLPSDLNAFKNQTKAVSTKNDVRFKRLFKKLKNNSEITVLRNVLNYLKSNQYKSNRADLLMLFQ
jgi:hypothetical protein